MALDTSSALVIVLVANHPTLLPCSCAVTYLPHRSGQCNSTVDESRSGWSITILVLSKISDSKDCCVDYWREEDLVSAQGFRNWSSFFMLSHSHSLPCYVKKCDDHSEVNNLLMLGGQPNSFGSWCEMTVPWQTRHPLVPANRRTAQLPWTLVPNIFSDWDIVTFKPQRCGWTTESRHLAGCVNSKPVDRWEKVPIQDMLHAWQGLAPLSQYAQIPAISSISYFPGILQSLSSTFCSFLHNLVWGISSGLPRSRAKTKVLQERLLCNEEPTYGLLCTVLLRKATSLCCYNCWSSNLLLWKISQWTGCHLKNNSFFFFFLLSYTHLHINVNSGLDFLHSSESTWEL